MAQEVYFNISINGEIFYITKEDLLFFSASVSAGAIKPYFKVSFRTSDDKLIESVVPNNKVIVTFGQNRENSDEYVLDITEIENNSDATDKSTIITFGAVSNSKSFFLDKRTECFTGTSLEVIKEVLKKYHSESSYLETDILEVNEQPSIWNRTNQSVSDFLYDVWTHMNIMPSFPLFAIDLKGVPMLKDANKLMKQQPKYTFTDANILGQNKIKYFKTFKPKSYKEAYNIYAGSGKLVNTYNLSSGLEDVSILQAETILATSQAAATNTNSGFKILDGYTTSDNVHKGYWNAYFYNTDKLVNMSTLSGELVVLGNLSSRVRPLDLVYVEKSMNPTSRDCGKYIVDYVITEYSYSAGIITTIGVCRDNYNNIENNIVPIPEINKIVGKNMIRDLTKACRNLRTYIAIARGVIDGTVLNRVFTYAKSLKYMALTGFNMNFFGAKVNFNSSQEAVNSMRNLGNSIINSIINLFIPEPFNQAFRDIALNGKSMSSFSELLGKLEQFLPADIQMLISEMTGLICETMVALNSINDKQEESKANARIANKQYQNSTVTFSETASGNVQNLEVTEDMNTDSGKTNEQKVNDVLDKFSENTSGADIPMPIIKLSDSDSFLNDSKLEDYLADKVIEELEGRGYLKDIDKDNFKDILEGKSDMDFATINKIETNIGNTTYTRFWGVYDSVIELTDFFIKKSYKDKYKTPQTTKIVNAKAGQKVFIAYPSIEEIKIYINNELQKLDYAEMDLGYVDSANKPLMYNVYYTEKGYNSNSVVVEIRKKV